MIPVDQAGVPTYDELVLVVREDEAHTRRPGPARLPAGAHAGEREVRADPAAAAALLVKANPSLEPKLQLESIEQTLPAALPAERERALRLAGTLGVGRVRRAGCSRTGCSSTTPDAGLPPFTNEFLPGQGI